MSGIFVMPIRSMVDGQDIGSMNLLHKKKVAAVKAGGNALPVSGNSVIIITEAEGDIHTLKRRPAETGMAREDTVVHIWKSTQIFKLIK